MLASVSRRYPEPKGRFPRVTHPCATRAEALVRLACVRHAASVRSEPGSNSQVQDERDAHSTWSPQSNLTQAFETVVSYCIDQDAPGNRKANPQTRRPVRVAASNTAACASLLTTRYQLVQETAAPFREPHRPAFSLRCGAKRRGRVI